MLSLYKILTVARYEMKTLLRSWFFRIFSILAILILILLDIGMHTKVGRTPWFMNGLNASLPYMDILLLNVVQAIIGVFLASDFLKRDKKLDTTEVIYMRSMTNGDYVLGKMLGILLVFLALNIIVLIISAIFHIFFSQASFVLAPYFLYPLLISLPTLMFIFGLSFLFMVVIRNQAVTFIVLLGYIAVTLFFLASKAHYIFDYMAFNVPLTYSDFVGFGNLGAILIHRGIYFLLGLGFVFATIFMIKRLPQSSAMTRFSGVFSVLCIAAAITLGFVYLSGFSQGTELRSGIMELNKQFVDKAAVQPVRYDVTLLHQGDKIDVNAKLVFKNATDKNIDEYLFTLNPGLKVKAVSSRSGKISFTQQKNLILVNPTAPLSPGQVDSLTFAYAGSINEQACYLDADEKARQKLYRLWMYNVAKKFAFIEPDYVLLTPAAEWYPGAGLPTSALYPQKTNKNFFSFNLNVKTNPKFTVISQGRMEDKGDGKFVFTSDRPLTQRTLVIGKYEQKSIAVDSVNYRLFYLKSHDYFSSYFTDIGDTLAALIRDTKQDYENKIGLEYVFPRFSLVEVPIQFFYYPHLWTVGTEAVQPEMALVHEKGILMNGADFSNQFRWQKRMTDRSNQSITPEERQSNVFTQFLRSGLLNSGFRRMFFEESMLGLHPDYHVFPNYFTYVNNFSSSSAPIFNVAFESYLSEKTSNPVSGFRRFFVGLTDDEKANLALANQSLEELLKDPAKKDIIDGVLKLKGQYLFQYIQSQIKAEKFDTFISDFLSQHHFSTTKISEFTTALKQKSNFDLMPYFEQWYKTKKLPAFLTTNIVAYKFIDNDRTRYQIKFKIENTEDVEGLISVSFRMAGGHGRFFGMGRSGADQPEEKFFRIGANEIKEIGVVLDDEPRMLTINTLISKNLPATISRRFDNLEMDKKAVAFEGVRNLKDHLRWIEPNEIVVDNEDAGFAALSQHQESFIKKLFRSKNTEDEKYIGFNFWRPPANWRATTNADFFGKFIHSAHYLKSGDGNKRAVWTAEIKKSGQYDVYYYSTKIEMPWMRRGRRKNNFIQDFHFIVHHDDGEEEVELDMSNVETGWSLLGTYYISAGKTQVELTNKSKGRVVFADAVKWVRH
ncbi:MAG: hypothetical protein GXO74_01665 [Calditrichaeota bacterium]|nr:hypothetical protein [Calditrichota bacterium]